jgi:hypothetical protein
MNLGLSGLTFTANYPYPNLLCTVKFYCNSNPTEISPEFYVSSYSSSDMDPILNNDVRIVTYTPISNLDL